MEACLTFDEVAVFGEGDAAFGEDGVEVGKGFEVPVDDGLVEMDPQRLGGLEFGRVGRQVDQAEAFGHGKRRGVPSGPVEHQEDDAVGSRAGLAGEEGEGVLEQAFVDTRAEIPEAFPGGGRDEGGDVEPFEAVVAGGDGAQPARGPDPAEDGLQPDPVLVGREDLNCRAGMALGFLGDGRGQLFLNADCASGVAACACRGRGRWIVQPMVRSASQPRCSATRARPSAVAITSATFFAVQTPPSSGGDCTRSDNIARTSGVRSCGFAPLPRRRSPSEDGPKRLYRTSNSSTQRRTNPVSPATSAQLRPSASSQIT